MTSPNTYRKVRKIRDVIHDYIDITSIEERLINSKEFQRLRYISQNSLAYFTYPSNTTNRFAHSLGVMHIGGQMFTASLNNSNKITLEKFIEDGESLVKEICKKQSIEFDAVVEHWIKTFGNISKFNHLPHDLSEPKWLDKKELVVINLLWQAVRIGCILHDIGHYPYSHLFEFAYEKFKRDLRDSNSIEYDINEKYQEIISNIPIISVGYDSKIPELPLHEKNGVLLLDKLKIPTTSDKFDIISNICLTLGKIIFVYNKSNETYDSLSISSNDRVLRCLHTIISSDIDADRLDYCRRDPVNSGMQLGAYDLQRILDSTILKSYENINDGYSIVFGITALSSIEEFFHQRFLMYEYLIFHHNVLRLDGTLEYIIYEILKYIILGDLLITKVLLDFEFVKEIEKGKFKLFPKRDQFYKYDDSWCKSMLTVIYDEILLNPEGYEKLKIALEIVLFRNTNHIYSLWKRTNSTNGRIQEIQNKLVDLGKRFDKIDIINSFNDLFKDITIKFESRFIKHLKDMLEEINVVMIYKATNKRILKKKIVHNAKILNGNVLENISDSSRYIKSLEVASENTINYNFFFISTNIKNNVELQAKATELLLEEVKEYIIKKGQ